MTELANHFVYIFYSIILRSTDLELLLARIKTFFKNDKDNVHYKFFKVLVLLLN